MEALLGVTHSLTSTHLREPRDDRELARVSSCRNSSCCRQPSQKQRDGGRRCNHLHKHSKRRHDSYKNTRCGDEKLATVDPDRDAFG